MELKGRTIVITGAGSGIGRALAERFADEAPRALILGDVNEEAVQEVAGGLGDVATAVRTDVWREAGIRALVDEARRVGGQVDVFFSNAGVPGPDGGPVESSDEEWDPAWRINVMAHVWAARAVLPEMLERQDGYLVSTASAAGILTQVGALVYSTTKHAAVAVAEWLAITYGDRGIKVSCVCPLGVRTPMLDTALQDRFIGPATVVAVLHDAPPLVEEMKPASSWQVGGAGGRRVEVVGQAEAGGRAGRRPVRAEALTKPGRASQLNLGSPVKPRTKASAHAS